MAPGRFRRARAFGVYDRTLMALIHRFKYGGAIQLAAPFGDLLFYTLISCWKTDRFDMVLPVPLHAQRMRRRGFNQAYLMIRQWDRYKKVLSVPYERIARDVLLRIRKTDPQTGLGRQKRVANMKNAFQLNPAADVTDLRILLIDDVYTTGATVNECARVLLDGGARHVDVLALARRL